MEKNIISDIIQLYNEYNTNFKDGRCEYFKAAELKNNYF